MIFGTVVAYDWPPEGAESLTKDQMDAQLEIEVARFRVVLHSDQVDAVGRSLTSGWRGYSPLGSVEVVRHF